MSGKSYTRATAIFLPFCSLQPKEPTQPRATLYRVQRNWGCVAITHPPGPYRGLLATLGGFSRDFCGRCGNRSDAPERDYEKLVTVDPFIYETLFGQVLRYTLELFQVADASLLHNLRPRDVHSGFVPRICDGCSKDVKRFL